MPKNTSPLIFGIYPGSHVGVENAQTAGPPDDPTRIQQALSQLQPEHQPFLVRGYLQYTGPLDTVQMGLPETPKAVEQYCTNGRKLDLVLRFRQPDLSGWLTFIRQTLHRYHPWLAKVQITEEPNMTTSPPVDGCIPHVREALVQGVIAAKEEAQRHGFDIQVGFNATPPFQPNDDFWPAIGALGGQPFLDALDYVGLDFFPAVFRPVAPGQSGSGGHSDLRAHPHYRKRLHDRRQPLP